MTLLKLDHVTGGYGDIIVVREISFQIAAGESVALMGRNGAGKTSLLRLATGLLSCKDGTIEIDGRDVSALPAYARAGLGVAFVQEGKRIFKQRTVEENLILGSYSTRMRKSVVRERVQRAYDRYPILAERRGSVAGSLSGGQQQMLALAQALIRDPALLVLDEPSVGLAPSIVEEVYREIALLREAGLAILLVEQSVPRALSAVDRVVMLELGRVIYDGAPTGDAAEAAIGRMSLTS